MSIGYVAPPVPLANLSDADLDTMAELQALVADATVLDTTAIDTIAELNTIIGDATIQVQPAEGAFVDGDKTKLNDIETAADVTDFTNVNAALAAATSAVTIKSSTVDLLKLDRTANADVDDIVYMGVSALSSSANDYFWIGNGTPSANRHLRLLLNSGSLMQGAASLPSGGASGGKILVQGDSVTAATGVVTNTSVLQSIAGEQWVVNDSDTATQISPHSKRAPSTMYDLGPGIDQMRETRIPNFPNGGKVIYVAEDRRARLAELTVGQLNQLTPGQRQTIHEETFAERNARLPELEPLIVGDWEAQQDSEEADHNNKVANKSNYDAEKSTHDSAMSDYQAAVDTITPLIEDWDTKDKAYKTYLKSLDQWEADLFARDRWEQLTKKAKKEVREPEQPGSKPSTVNPPAGKRPELPYKPAELRADPEHPGDFKRRANPFV